MGGSTILLSGLLMASLGLAMVAVSIFWKSPYRLQLLVLGLGGLLFGLGKTIAAFGITELGWYTLLAGFGLCVISVLWGLLDVFLRRKRLVTSANDDGSEEV